MLWDFKKKTECFWLELLKPTDPITNFLIQFSKKTIISKWNLSMSHQFEYNNYTYLIKHNLPKFCDKLWNVKIFQFQAD